jgi:uncharacterized protein (DUF3084 family)
MNPTETAQIITALSAMVGAVSSIGGLIISSRNSRALAVVKHQTDGLVEVLSATKLAQGTAEGTAIGLKQGRDESKSEVP